MTQDNKPRDYHFGTDIPIPTMEETEIARSRRGEDDEGAGLLVLILICCLAVLIIIGALVFQGWN